MTEKTSPQIHAIILAGGLARRMNGVEKGLQKLQNLPLIAHILQRLSPQLLAVNGKVYLNINRSQAEYQLLFPHLPFYQDEMPNFQGALSGMLTGFHQIESDYLLFVPCDSPFLPENLLKKLLTALQINQVEIAYAHDGEWPHPTFALIHRNVAKALNDYLQMGERRLYQFFQQQKSVAVDFSEQKEAFWNFNTLEELATAEMPRTKPAVLAITGYSGTGKTTLLEKLIPKLTACNLKVGLIKHSHHNIDVDKPGKDSHRLRLAGANPTVIACDERWALMTETPEQAVDFQQIIANFKDVDLVLVEGFKHEALPKIQLHRKEVKKPLPELDEWTIATATDYPLERENRLNINNVDEVAEFVKTWLKR